jgi:type I restriction-modification system DNA methylase subunit
MDFQTPDWVSEIMVKMVDIVPKTILEPTAGEGKLLRVIKRGFPSAKVFAPQDIFEFEPKQEIDCAIMNPPFSPMKLGFEILQLVSGMTDNIISVVPWLHIINSVRRVEWFKENGLCEIIHLPRKAFKGSRVQTCVIKLCKGSKFDFVTLKFAE